MQNLSTDEILSEIRQGKHLKECDIHFVFSKLIEILKNEDNFLNLSSPINVIGDIHGQLFDLFSCLEKSEEQNDKTDKYLFLGDYVDRGNFSIETITYVACLKIKFPDKIFILRGNHESPAVNQMYGFYMECHNIYGSTSIWNLVNISFQYFPLAASIDDTYFCVHGGLSPDLPLADKLYLVDRICDVPERGMVADLLWSDPSATVNKWQQSSRGCGFLFGYEQTEQFLYNNNLKMILRSHQLVDAGYEELFEKDDKSLLATVWSAPNYCSHGNRATFMLIHGNDYRFIEFDQKIDKPFDHDIKIGMCPYFA